MLDGSDVTDGEVDLGMSGDSEEDPRVDAVEDELKMGVGSMLVTQEVVADVIVVSAEVELVVVTTGAVGEVVLAEDEAGTGEVSLTEDVEDVVGEVSLVVVTDVLCDMVVDDDDVAGTCLVITVVVKVTGFGSMSTIDTVVLPEPVFIVDRGSLVVVGEAVSIAVSTTVSITVAAELAELELGVP